MTCEDLIGIAIGLAAAMSNADKEGEFLPLTPLPRRHRNRGRSVGQQVNRPQLQRTPAEYSDWYGTDCPDRRSP